MVNDLQCYKDFTAKMSKTWLGKPMLVLTFGNHAIIRYRKSWWGGEQWVPDDIEPLHKDLISFHHGNRFFRNLSDNNVAMIILKNS